MLSRRFIAILHSYCTDVKPENVQGKLLQEKVRGH